MRTRWPRAARRIWTRPSSVVGATQRWPPRAASTGTGPWCAAGGNGIATAPGTSGAIWPSSSRHFIRAASSAGVQFDANVFMPVRIGR